MTLPIEDILRRYLHREVELKRLREWLALFQWDLDAERQALADEADEAIVRFDDGHIREDDVRQWLATVLESYATQTVHVVVPDIDTRHIRYYGPGTGTAAVTRSPIPVQVLVAA
ncbi:MAG: hypothetical protein Q7T26_11170 [Dehalococcoidia bacterium]|nr:hypothetical protein [Dehalococcoidia bacterium]